MHEFEKSIMIIFVIRTSNANYNFIGQMTAFDKSRDAASYLASKFLSRPDTKQTHLPDFIDWALQLCTKGSFIVFINCFTDANSLC